MGNEAYRKYPPDAETCPGICRLTLKPGQEGTKQLTEKYGDALVCVRYRYNEKTGKRLKTVELIEEQTDWTPPPPRFAPETLVPLRIAASNMSVRAKVKKAGGKWVPEEQFWYVRYGVIAGGQNQHFLAICLGGVQ